MQESDLPARIHLVLWAAFALAMIGFNGMVFFGVVDAKNSVYAGPRLIWLSNMTGGLLFGFGMVLASGCGNKTLVRLGTGSLKSLVVFAVLGITTFGVIVGAFIVAISTRTFRGEGCAGAQDTANHLVGALLMGVGGVSAVGCTIGQGLSGVSTLALGSFIAFAAIIAGAVLALRYQAWRIDQLGGA